jgi:hypothetical protein
LMICMLRGQEPFPRTVTEDSLLIDSNVLTLLLLCHFSRLNASSIAVTTQPRRRLHLQHAT